MIYPKPLDELEVKLITSLSTIEALEKETNETELSLNDTLFELAAEPTAQFAAQYKQWYQPTTQDWKDRKKEQVSSLMTSMKQYQSARQEWTSTLVKIMQERKGAQGQDDRRKHKTRVGFEQSKFVNFLKEEKLQGAGKSLFLVSFPVRVSSTTSLDS